MRFDSTPLLPGFPTRLGRPLVSRAARLRRTLAEAVRHRLDEFRDLFSPWIDTSLLVGSEKSRKRIFTTDWVFWAFLLQLLIGSGCRGAVKLLQSWAVARGLPVPSSNPNAYCQARRKLSLDMLRRIFLRLVEKVSKRLGKKDLWHGFRVKIVDGTGLSAADTDANQEVWPQSSNMKPGCGFPELKVLGLRCLHSGVLLDWAEGNKHNHELTLWRRLWTALSPGDLVLGDRAFGTYPCIAALLGRGVQGVYRLHGGRGMDWRKGRRLGRRDRLCIWTRPRKPGKGWTAEEWAELPEQLEIRVLEREVCVPGFRTRKIALATTLTDAVAFSAEELMALYRRRWEVEVGFRDIKITLGMDVLECQSPETVRRELSMYMICHNLLRAMMLDAAREKGEPVERISFKGALEQLREWLWLFFGAGHTHAERRRRLKQFYAALADAPVPERPDRSEPRVRKRRPKNYRLMTRARNQRRQEEAA